jgi:hypothetical protein
VGIFASSPPQPLGHPNGKAPTFAALKLRVIAEGSKISSIFIETPGAISK